MCKRDLVFASMVLCMIFPGRSSFGETINADSCSREDVVDAIERAADCNTGFADCDTVIVPGGECTWPEAVVIPDGKAITLQGAGNGEEGTVINCSGCLEIHSPSRITSFRFMSHDSGGSMISIRSLGWMVDNCYFHNPEMSSRYGIVPRSRGADDPRTGGVAWGNTFVRVRNVTGAFSIFNRASWALPTALGGSYNSYFEDNVIDFTGNTSGNCLDTNYGVGYVGRYNEIISTQYQIHSLQANNTRGSRQWEMYGTRFFRPDYMWTQYFIRGGVGVVFYNRHSGPAGSSNHYITIDNVRSFSNRIGIGRCSGYSPWDGNEPLTEEVWGVAGSGEASEVDPLGLQLTDSAKTWPDLGCMHTASGTGTHVGAESETMLVKAEGDDWSVSTADLVNLYVRNVTENSGCLITENTQNTVTCSSGLIRDDGGPGVWRNGDVYEIYHIMGVYNLTDGSKAAVWSSEGGTIKHSQLVGGTSNAWNVGDEYKVTDGYPCRDQIGAGQDLHLWTDENPYPPFRKEPSYSWAVMSSNDEWVGFRRHNTNYVCGALLKHIVEDRDYYNYNTAFDGTSGVGCGAREDMESIEDCTEGVAFWVKGNENQSCTDLENHVGIDPLHPVSGVLYRCNPNAGKKWEAIYTPYSYPHPMRGGTLYSLTVNLSGEGTVRSTSMDIDSETGKLTTSIRPDHFVILNAYQSGGPAFSGWSGACACRDTNQCVLRMNEAKDVTAHFGTEPPHVDCCDENADCDDGDECTEGVCEEGLCVFNEIPGCRDAGTDPDADPGVDSDAGVGESKGGGCSCNTTRGIPDRLPLALLVLFFAILLVGSKKFFQADT